MQTFQILYLRHNKLEHSEVLFGLDLLQAIERASHRVPDLSAEIWSEQGRVGIVEPLPDRTEAPRQIRESEIAGLMLCRLQLTR